MRPVLPFSLHLARQSGKGRAGSAAVPIDLKDMHWVIVGGESGPGAREMKEEWVKEIRSQCRKLHIPFFFKQWGGVVKSRTGRELDGRTYDEFPKVLAA